MAQTPKKKRLLPKNITERPDSEALELIFGKRIRRELEKTAQEFEKKGNNESMEVS